MNIQKYVAKGSEAILDLPISVVTQELGTEGLRVRYAHEVMRAFDDREVIEMAGRAHDLGARLHRGDRRSHEPVENHLLRGAIRVLSLNHLGYWDSFMPAIMMNHDGPEDHPHKLAGVRKRVPEAEARRLAIGKLAIDFAPEVAQGVEWMTNPLPELGKPSLALYLEHGHSLIASGPARSIVGKLGDFFDNGTGIFWSLNAAPEQSIRRAHKYIQFAPILQRGLYRSDVELSEQAINYANAQFEQTVHRCALVIMKNGVRADFISHP